VRWLLFLSLLFTALRADAWTTVEPPPQASLEWVAQDMVFNGIGMRVQFFRSKLAPAEVLAYYRQQWTEGGRRNYVENNFGPWKMISHGAGEYLVTVQVRPAGNGNSEGYLSQRPLKTPPRLALGQGFVLPPGSEVVNDIQSRDGDRQGRTLLAFNSLAVDANAAFFRSSLEREGWSLVSEGRAKNGGRQLVMRHASDELSLAMTAKGGRTAVGATLVRH
jgi:hypothetical protein